MPPHFPDRRRRRNRSVPVHPQLALALDAWIAERRMWPGADTAAVFLNRAGARLPVIATNSGVQLGSV